MEIERKYLLRAVPELPAGATSSRLEQGYLAPADPTDDDDAEDATGVPRTGRLRRESGADGRVRLLHTIKRGVGVEREERERELDAATFERAWPGTEGRRLRKTRWRVPVDTPHGPRTWEIDVFEDRPLVLAELELGAADEPVTFPAWLEPHVVREVTDDPAFTNARLALDQNGNESPT